jgi:oligosaccharide repeat unit polymerase
MLKNFIRVWLLYWLAVALLPVYSLHPATVEAFLLQAAFVCLVALSFGVVDLLAGAKRMPSAGFREIASAASIVRVSLLLSAIGLVALAYDKIAVQGIDYSDGVALAREEWRRLGEERDGSASSAYSAIAYLFGSAYFVAVVLVITQTRVLSSRQRWLTLALCFLLMMGNALLSGGRSNVLLLAAFVLSAFSARRGLEFRTLLTGRAQRVLVRALVGLSISYMLYIFYERAAALGDSAIEYVFDFLPFLGVDAMASFRAMLDTGPLSALGATLVLALSYITHSFAIVAAIIDGPSEDKTILFLHSAVILHKLGLAGAPDGDWFLSGRFPSLPGALWYQYGALGLATASVILGALAACCKAWASRRPDRLTPLGCYLLVDAILLLSPALFAADFLSFPFVAGSFIMLALWAAWRSGGGARA